jgi:hypothetical protein
MSHYNKQVATDLYADLQGLLSPLPDRIKTAKDDGPAIMIICDGLVKAIAALKTVVRP